MNSLKYSNRFIEIITISLETCWNRWVCRKSGKLKSPDVNMPISQRCMNRLFQGDLWLFLLKNTNKFTDQNYYVCLVCYTVQINREIHIGSCVWMRFTSCIWYSNLHDQFDIFLTMFLYNFHHLIHFLN